MALTYDMTQVKAFKKLKKKWQRTETLVFATMVLALGEITEENAYEFWCRMHFYEEIFGEFFPGEPYTEAEIVMHIGLRTNVSRETDAQFLKRMWKNYTRKNQKRSA